VHPPQDTSHLAHCSCEEADIRMNLHLAGAINKGFHTIYSVEWPQMCLFCQWQQQLR